MMVRRSRVDFSGAALKNESLRFGFLGVLDQGRSGFE